MRHKEKKCYSIEFLLTQLKIFYSLSFLACMEGFIGGNCSDLCPYPYYGQECQKRCNCSKDMCDVSIGCTGFDTGKHFLTILNIFVHKLHLYWKCFRVPFETPC